MLWLYIHGFDLSVLLLMLLLVLLLVLFVLLFFVSSVFVVFDDELPVNTKELNASNTEPAELFEEGSRLINNIYLLYIALYDKYYLLRL